MTCVTLDIREGGRPLRQCRGCYQKKQIGRGAGLPATFLLLSYSVKINNYPEVEKTNLAHITDNVSRMIKSSS